MAADPQFVGGTWVLAAMDGDRDVVTLRGESACFDVSLPIP